MNAWLFFSISFFTSHMQFLNWNDHHFIHSMSIHMKIKFQINDLIPLILPIQKVASDEEEGGCQSWKGHLDIRQKKWVVSVSNNWIRGVESISVVLVERSIYLKPLRQVRIGQKQAPICNQISIKSYTPHETLRLDCPFVQESGLRILSKSLGLC